MLLSHVPPTVQGRGVRNRGYCVPSCCSHRMVECVTPPHNLAAPRRSAGRQTGLRLALRAPRLAPPRIRGAGPRRSMPPGLRPLNRTTAGVDGGSRESGRLRPRLCVLRRGPARPSASIGG